MVLTLSPPRSPPPPPPQILNPNCRLPPKNRLRLRFGTRSRSAQRIAAVRVSQFGRRGEREGPPALRQDPAGPAGRRALGPRRDQDGKGGSFAVSRNSRRDAVAGEDTDAYLHRPGGKLEKGRYFPITAAQRFDAGWITAVARLVVIHQKRNPETRKPKILKMTDDDDIKIFQQYSRSIRSTMKIARDSMSTAFLEWHKLVYSHSCCADG